MNALVRMTKRWLSHFLPNCNEAALLISRSIDARLPFWDRLKMRLHQWTCLFCTRYEEQIVFVHRSMRELGSQINEQSGPPMSDDAKDRLKRALGNG